MAAALAAGAAYFLAVFAAGFVLGTLRTLAIAPALGAAAAVALELPVMLAISWIACARLVRRFGVAPAAAPRLAMGAMAFSLLLLGELALSVLLLGRSPAEHLATYRELPAQLGLGAQSVFALMPLLQVRRP